MRVRLFWVTGMLVLVSIAVFGAGAAQAVDVQHGIGFTKGCTSPTKIGDPYSCSYSARNVLDEAQDTLTINGLVDVVHGSGGNVSSGNIFSTTKLDNCANPDPAAACVPTAATCTGGTGTGTRADPYIGATLCTLPFGSRINFESISHYTVAPGDFALPGNTLRDDAALAWHDLCNDPTGTGNTNCNPNPPDVSAASQSLILQLASSTATDIHNAAHAVVTTVGAGSTVHDFVTVTGQPGSPPPSGNVTIDWFLNNGCTGSPAVTSAPIALNGAGQVDATGFAFTVNTAGGRAFKAHYAGDATYTPSDGPCEPLQVVDANIQITPPNANNAIGTNHTLTGHVNVNDGTGFVNAPAGTLITFSKVSGPGSFVGGVNTCTTVAATGSCTVQITSPTPGITVVNAATDVTVGGVSLHRATGDGLAGDSANAQKNWVDANIQITPPTANNEVGTNHTLTGHVNVNDGTGYVNAPAGTLITFSLTNAGGATAVFVGPNTCNTVAATGSCTVVISSPTAGTTTIKAATDVTVAGISLHRETGDGKPGDSANAVKDWEGGGGQITHTNVSCEDVLSGASGLSLIDGINYQLSGGKITQSINPGKFFFWTKITTTVPNQVVTVTQTNTSTNNAALFQVHQGWARVYRGNCNSWKSGTLINGESGASFTIAAPGSYIIGIKYDPKSLVGTNCPVPATITYDFTTSLGGTTGASVVLKKQT